MTYDLTHTYASPGRPGAGRGRSPGPVCAVALALVWFAHIGMDRALGLGLQYPDGSGCTHLRETASRRGRHGGGAWTG